MRSPKLTPFFCARWRIFASARPTQRGTYQHHKFTQSTHHTEYIPEEKTIPAIALIRAQKVENDAPARLLLFCSPLLLLPALLGAGEVVAVVFFSTRLVLSRDGCTCTLAAKALIGICGDLNTII